MKRLLFIAHYFPPLGGAGVQRAAKFVKYLPEFGWQPLVLTGSGKHRNQWSPEDASLMQDVSGTESIFRADWQPGKESAAAKSEAFVRLGEKVIQEFSPDLIFVTMSPFEDTAIAAELSSRSGLPWVADLRDPWALDEFQVYRTFLHRNLARRRMRRSLSSARLVIMNTPEARDRLVSQFPEFSRKSVTCITNGYDAEDFAEPILAPGRDRFTIVHSGFLHTGEGLKLESRRGFYSALGRITPGVRSLTRSHYYLVQAVQNWFRARPEVVDRVRLRFIGSQTEVDKSIVTDPVLKKVTTFEGYLPHAESVRSIRSASVLFLPMHTLPPGMRASIVPGKTYEYMAAGRPILAAVPESDAKDFLETSGLGHIVRPDDVAGMEQMLDRLFNDWASGCEPSPNSQFIQRFERKRLTEQLAASLDQLQAAPREAVFA